MPRLVALKRAKEVTVLTGPYKSKKYKVKKIDKKGKVYLEQVYGLNSKKKVYNLKFDPSNLKI